MDGEKQQSRVQKVAWIVALIVGGLGVFLSLAPAHFLLILIGLVPTLAAWFASQPDEHKYRLPTIVAFNITGLLPFVVELWQEGRSFDTLLRLLVDLKTWLIMYGAVGLGLLLLWLAPQVAAYLIQLRANDRMRAIERQQRKIAEEWGFDISGGDGRGNVNSTERGSFPPMRG